MVNEPMTVPSVEELKATVVEVLAIAQTCLGNLDTERARAKAERNPLVRQYSCGLVDGMEEATHRLMAPFAAWLKETDRG